MILGDLYGTFISLLPFNGFLGTSYLSVVTNFFFFFLVGRGDGKLLMMMMVFFFKGAWVV